MSYHERQEAAGNQRQKPQRAARQWASKPLTPAQKTALAMLAKDAFAIHLEAGLCDTDEKTFRHVHVTVASGKNGLRECNNSHFRAIKAHFLRLLGRHAEAEATWAETGRVQGSTEPGDTHENREAAMFILANLVRISEGAIDDNYVESIARDEFLEFPQIGLAGLRASQLQTLVFVVTQRLRQKRPDLNI
jgi:hypothetical protein